MNTRKQRKKIRNAINGVYPPMSHAEENAAYYEENIVSVSNFKVGCAAFIVAPNADMEPQDKYMDIDRVRVKETSTKNRSVTVDSGEVFAENNDRFDCLIGEDEESCSSYARRLFPTRTAAKKERKKCLLLALIQEEFKQTDNTEKYTVRQLKRAKTALGIEEGVHANND